MSRAVRYTWNRLKSRQAGTITFTACGAQRFETPANNYSGFIAATFGERDLNIVRFWPHVLKNGSVFFDVGANIGLYSISASKYVGPAGRVIGFEAHPMIHRYLVSNVARNAVVNVVAENLAVGAESGEARIAFCDNNAGQTHVASTTEDGVVVPMVTLDDYCFRNGISRIDYIKVDVEGYELQVIKGAASIISASDSILIQTEFVSQNLRRYGSPDELVELLTAWGFLPHTITWSNGSAQVLDSLEGYRGEVVWSRTDLTSSVG
ncbi:FkbM family methyltransferase [Mycolicibacterium sp. XJ879]